MIRFSKLRWFLLFWIASPVFAIEILSSPLTSSFGIGTGFRAETQYSDIQPTLFPAFSLSEDFRWRRLQGLVEWTRWSEKSSSGVLSVNTRQDLYSLFGRVELLRDSWLGVFVGAGLGFQQDRTDTTFGVAKKSSTGGLDTYYGGEAGVTFYLWSNCDAQIFGRLTSQPHDSRWNQWVAGRLAYRVF